MGTFIFFITFLTTPFLYIIITLLKWNNLFSLSSSSDRFRFFQLPLYYYSCIRGTGSICIIFFRPTSVPISPLTRPIILKEEMSDNLDFCTRKRLYRINVEVTTRVMDRQGVRTIRVSRIYSREGWSKTDPDPFVWVDCRTGIGVLSGIRPSWVYSVRG